MPSTDFFESRMDRAWPAPESLMIDGWRLRFAGGVTRRANSVLPTGQPLDVDAAIEKVEACYVERGLAPTFQMSPAARPSDLDSRLADRGYRVDAPTLVMTAEPGLAAALPVVAQPRLASRPAIAAIVADEPDDAWLDLWWLVDGRGNSAARAVARSILTGVPARYVSLADERGLAAVGRVALVDGWGGIYCMAVRPDARRRGLGTAVLRALAEAAAGRPLWLQVVAANEPAQSLYAKAGFASSLAHHYRVLDAE